MDGLLTEALALTEQERTMGGKEELLKLAYKQLDQAAMEEELLALEAEALAVKVDLAEAALHPILPRRRTRLGPPAWEAL